MDAPFVLYEKRFDYLFNLIAYDLQNKTIKVVHRIEV
jgi:hypothetical protein